MSPTVQNQWIERLKRSGTLILLSLPLIPIFLFLRTGWHLGVLFTAYEAGLVAFLMRRDFRKNLERIPRQDTARRWSFLVAAGIGSLLMVAGLFLAVETLRGDLVTPRYLSLILLIAGLVALASTEFLARGRSVADSTEATVIEFPKSHP